jgi:hypothetical protein
MRTLRTLKRVKYWLDTVFEGDVIPFGDGQYEYFTEFYESELSVLHDLVDKAIELEENSGFPKECPFCETLIYFHKKEVEDV